MNKRIIGATILEMVNGEALYEVNYDAFSSLAKLEPPSNRELSCLDIVIRKR